MLSVGLPVSVAGLRAYRSTNETLHAGVKQHYAIGRVERGRSEFWARGKVWRSEPGTVQVKEPGDVHRDLAIDGAITWTVVTLPAADIERVRDDGNVVSLPQLAANDARALPFHRLHDAVCANADRFTLEVALAEAVGAFGRLRNVHSEHTRPVRRAMEYLRAQLAEPVTLDAIARYAGLDKFHLCRAFRAQIGMPPHAYLTHLRIDRAKTLLRQGVRASELAPQVGLYDQSLLTRHFRRIVGVTPARYASARR